MKIIRPFILILALVAALFVLWVCLAPSSGCNYNRLNLSGVLVQLFLSFLTLFTLIWSIWGAEIRNWLDGPVLDLISGVDETHCILAGGDWEDSPTAVTPRVRIYAHVTNKRASVAHECQVICSQIYVSMNDTGFVPLKNILPASFKWVYSPWQDQTFMTDVRKSVDKYFKILEIVQQNSGRDCEDGGNMSHSKADNVSWFEINIPGSDGCRPGLRVETRYRRLLIPLTVVARSQKDLVKYLRVSWNGDDVLDFRKPGMLEVEVLDETDGKNLLKNRGAI